jgi:hypothetical protein
MADLINVYDAPYRHHRDGTLATFGDGSARWIPLHVFGDILATIPTDSSSGNNLKMWNPAAPENSIWGRIEMSR